MAWEQVPEMFEWAQAAGADLTGKTFYFAKLDASGNFILAAAATDNIVGVIRQEAAAGDPATVLLGGVGKAIAAGTIAPGAYITSDGNGKAVATTNAGDRVCGQCLSFGVDAGDIFSFLVCRFNY